MWDGFSTISTLHDANSRRYGADHREEADAALASHVDSVWMNG
jgi:hypothetical protein